MADGGALGGVVDSVKQIGRHFAVAVGVPSLIATVLPATLLAAGAPRHRPTLDAAVNFVRSIGLAEAGVLFVVVVGLGLVMLPLQFALTQALEGYWGLSGPAQRAMLRCANAHLRRARALAETSLTVGWDVAESNQRLESLSDRRARLENSPRPTPTHDLALLRAIGAEASASLPNRLRLQEADRLLARYPVNLADVMPTRLGNALRRPERAAGEPYGLDAISVAALLSQVADPTLRDYYDDARTDLDLGIQMVLVWGWCTVVSMALLWPYSVWMIVPSCLAGLTYIGYRGAVAAAEAFGEALVALVALGRPNLYAALRLPEPTDSDQEVSRNELVARQLAGDRVQVRYETRAPVTRRSRLRANDST